MRVSTDDKKVVINPKVCQFQHEICSTPQAHTGSERQVSIRSPCWESTTRPDVCQQ
ncbi:hypothetical protein J6590_000208 [Homalodisca vitripennis]|nr:hypothetical protein J6590_000208 [Homalodisca vitripennis]